MSKLQFSRTALKKPQQPVGPPSIGVIAEQIRRVIVDTFDTYFPNLNMETQNDGKIVLKAQDPNSGLNFEVEIRDLNQTQMVPMGGTPAAPGTPQAPAPTPTSQPAVPTP